MSSWTLSNAIGLLHQQFPDAFVTSGKRDPNSALGRANPRSYHNIGEAFDIRPMQGVDFNTYVSRLKAAGLPVVEALDEATHPVGWTTGPNWHIAFNANAPAPEQDKKPMLTPEQRAAMFSVAIPPDQPSGFNIQQAAAQFPSLMSADAIPSGDFSQELAANAAKGQANKGKVPLWAKILGVIGDTYSEVNGRNGTFIPALQQQQQNDQEQNFAREKIQMQLDAQQSMLADKLGMGQDEYTRALIASGVKPGSPEWMKHMAARASILENPPRYEMVNGALVQVGGPSSLPTSPVGELTDYTGN